MDRLVTSLLFGYGSHKSIMAIVSNVVMSFLVFKRFIATNSAAQRSGDHFRCMAPFVV
ncbi:hypothetical protein BDR05DRAFT_212784 [Suillus weaverae]|nr:hypothetical protein BDR05DRAFT_212784 [Suillus weaverae]